MLIVAAILLRGTATSGINGRQAKAVEMTGYFQLRNNCTPRPPH